MVKSFAVYSEFLIVSRTASSASVLVEEMASFRIAETFSISNS